jgi:hypothetical protein
MGNSSEGYIDVIVVGTPADQQAVVGPIFDAALVNHESGRPL